MRRNATDAERLLWARLRRHSLEGAQFRRQHPIGPYVVDFVCRARRLVVEVDGGQHAEPDARRSDDARTEFLEDHGYRVLRFWNSEVLSELDGVLETIRRALSEG